MQEGQLTSIEHPVGAKRYCVLDRADLVQTSQHIWCGILLLHSAVGEGKLRLREVRDVP